MPPRNRPALVVLGDGLGNLVEGTPLAAAVAAKYRTIDVWAPRSGEAEAQVLTGLPGMRRLFVGPAPPPPTYAHCFATFLVAAAAAQAKARRLHLALAPRLAQKSEAAANLDVLRPLGWRGDMPKHWVATEASAQARALPAQLVGVSAGGRDTPTWRYKRYPHFGEVLAECVAARPGLRVVLLGAETDDAIDHPAIIDLRGRTSVPEAAAIARRCLAFIANDCGLAHVAAAVGTPTVVVFGPTETLKNLPPRNAVACTWPVACRPCQYSPQRIGFRPDGTACERECLRDLPPRVVADAVNKILQGRAPQGSSCGAVASV